jgi:predicted ATPase/transcriptional regulator with XRE-family HTH domain
MRDSSDFGRQLKQLRAVRDLTQEGLADLVGCAVQTIRAFEYGRRRPSREMAARLADVLAIPPEARAEFLRLARTTLDAHPSPPPPLPLVAPNPIAGTPLPHVPDTLIGRQAELERIVQMVAAGRRLVTLTGPGGIGKTRLAIQAAADLAPQFADGAAFVGLTSVEDAAHVPAAIAAALGMALPATQQPIEALCGLLRDQRRLLVLDNLEHLLHAPGDQLIVLITALLQAAPGLTVMTTSRERLRLQSEWVIELDGLSLPGDDATAIDHAPAVLLFLERARQTGEEFALAPENRAAVVRICRLLGGMPLGIELAAAWVRVLTPADIARALARSHELLITSARDVPARHRSLRAAFEHSWQLLTPAERYVLSHLAVLRGAFTREAAEAVLQGRAAGNVLLLLAGLIDKSLLRVRSAADGTARYAFHELIRQYAEAYLQADPPAYAAARAVHAHYFARWTQRQEPILQSALQSTAIEAFDLAIDNIRAAWRWAIEQRNAEVLNQICYPFAWFAEVRGLHHECAAMCAAGHTALRPLIEAGEPAPTVVRIFYLMQSLEGWHSVRSNPLRAAGLLQAGYMGMQTVVDPQARFQVTIVLSYLVGSGGDLPRALTLIDDCFAAADAAAYPWGAAIAEAVRMILAVLHGDFDLVRTHLPVALARAQAVGDPRVIANVLHSQGGLALHEGRSDDAEAIYRECLALSEARGDSFEIARSLQGLGQVALVRGDTAAAQELLGRSLQRARSFDDRWLETQALAGLSVLAARQGEATAARSLIRSAVQLSDHAPTPIALDVLATALQVRGAGVHAATDAVILAYLKAHPLTRIPTRVQIAAQWATLPLAVQQAGGTAAAAYAGVAPSGLIGLI